MFFLNIYRLLSLKGAYSTVYGSPTFPAFLPTEKPTNARFWFNFVGFCLRQQWGTCFSTRLSYCYCCCCSSSSYSYSYCYCYSSCCCCSYCYSRLLLLLAAAGCWLLASGCLLLLLLLLLLLVLVLLLPYHLIDASHLLQIDKEWAKGHEKHFRLRDSYAEPTVSLRCEFRRKNADDVWPLTCHGIQHGLLQANIWKKKGCLQQVSTTNQCVKMPTGSLRPQAECLRQNFDHLSWCQRLCKSVHLKKTLCSNISFQCSGINIMVCGGGHKTLHPSVLPMEFALVSKYIQHTGCHRPVLAIAAGKCEDQWSNATLNP